MISYEKTLYLIMEYSVGKSKIYIILVHFKPIATISSICDFHVIDWHNVGYHTRRVKVN